MSEGMICRAGAGLGSTVLDTQVEISEAIDLRMGDLRAHDAGHSARQQALETRQSEERAALKTQATTALAALKAQISTETDRLLSKHKREQYDLVAARYRLP
jgi:predicted secreted Zn-dependent protease